MPSDTRTDPPEPRFEVALSTLVVSIFLVLGLTVAFILVVSGYQIARKAIETDVERHRAGTQQIAHLIVSSRLQNVRQLIELTVEDSALRTAMARGDRQGVESHLTGVFYAQEEGGIDILFALLDDGGGVIDAGRQVHRPEELLQIAKDHQAFAMVDQVVELGRGAESDALVLSSQDVLDPETGRVLGTLYGGLSLDDNVSLVSAIGHASGASVAMLEVAGRTTDPVVMPEVPIAGAKGAALEGGAANGFRQFRSELPLWAPDGNPIMLISNHPLWAVQELGRSYRIVIVAIVATTIILAAIGAWILRQVTRRATASLSAYVAEVNRHDARARFRRTVVHEFNQVGQTLSRFVAAFRESDARAQVILNNAPISITIKAPDGVYTFVNREFESSIGLSALEVVGKQTGELFPVEIAEAINRSDQTVTELRTNVQFEAELELNGTFRAFLVTKFPLLSADGDVTGVCSITSDITQMKLSEKALTEALVAAESASQAKSRFLATMSHEFRTPLNAILGFSDLIRGEYMGPVGNATYAEYADDIHRSGQQMLELVDEVLDSAAIEAGQRLFNHDPVDLGAVIDEAVRRFQPAVADKRLTLAADVEDRLPEIRSDHRAIVQVLQNLLSNAVKFTQPDGRITVRAYEAAAPETGIAGVVLQVTDNGIGMTPEVVATVTEPFFQDKTDPHLAEAGTGLGLSIVKSIVGSLGGGLKIESELTKGTVVTVWLPMGEPSVG
ncbi:MAG: ATP-binding protein [Thalassobaculaceae bacterium]|nr:ATP-binding protein [Thalassobaculaceae bacterium]